MPRSFRRSDIPPTSIDWNEQILLARRGNGTAITTCLDRLTELEDFLAEAVDVEELPQRYAISGPVDDEIEEDEKPKRERSRFMIGIGWILAALTFGLLVVAAFSLAYGIVSRIVGWAF